MRQSRRPCTERTSRCPRARDLSEPTPECCRNHIRLLVFEFADLAADAGITWWMDYGTLLGAVRNPLLGIPPGLVPHDKDADLGFLATDWPKVEALRRTLRQKGRGWSRTPIRPDRPFRSGDRVKIRLSRRNRTNVDLFPWYRSPDGDYYRINYCRVDENKGREFPESKLFPLTEREWEGRMLPAPSDPEWFCEHRYQETWMEPIAANNAGIKVEDGYRVEAG